MLVDDYVDYIESKRYEASAKTRKASLKYYSKRFFVEVGRSGDNVISSLTRKEFILLKIIAVSECISLHEIVCYTKCNQKVIQHNLQILMRKNLIKVVSSPYDIKYYSVTDIALSIFREGELCAGPWEDE